MSTYNAVAKLELMSEYQQFHTNLNTMNQNFISGAAINSYFIGVEDALDNNFNYYKGYLLFVSGVTQQDQSYINNKIKTYQNAFLETNQLLLHFNRNLSVSEQIKTGMHANFVNAYKNQIKIYSELVEALKNYVIKYAFSNTLPVGLKQTLLQVQLDYVNVVIPQKLDAIILNNQGVLVDTAINTLYNELSSIKQKFASFNNNVQGADASVALFIEAYANFEHKLDYLNSFEKNVYILSYPSGLQRSYLETIHNFLMQESYN